MSTSYYCMYHLTCVFQFKFMSTEYNSHFNFCAHYIIYFVGLHDLLLLMLLLLNHFSRPRLCATPQTAAYQAPPSLGFSRQEHWSGLPFPSPIHESEKWKWSLQSCSTLSDPMDCSLPGSSILGIFQARVPEWIAIAFSGFALESRSNMWLNQLYSQSSWY